MPPLPRRYGWRSPTPGTRSPPPGRPVRPGDRRHLPGGADARHVRTVEFAAEVARTLRTDGTYLVNVTDLPPLVGTGRRRPRCGRSSPTCACSATGGCCAAGGTATWCWPRRHDPADCRSAGWRWPPCAIRCPAVCCTAPLSTRSSPAHDRSRTRTTSGVADRLPARMASVPIAPVECPFGARCRVSDGGRGKAAG
ncbi:hypothetical protein NKG94_12775 [Micromonospora sp. M12]